EARTASEKLGKVARLLGEAGNALTNYINTIAPGTAPRRKALPSSVLTGEQLVEDTERRADTQQRNIDSFLRRQVKKADDLQDTGKNVGENVQRGLEILRNPSRPSGASSQTPSVGPPPAPTKIEPGDATGNLVIVGLLAGVAVEKLTSLIARGIARLRNR